MANPQNLVRNEKRTPSELREITRKGGIASGKKRREKRTARDLMNLICSMPDDFETGAAEKLKALGVEQTEQNLIAAILLTQAKIAKDETNKSSTRAAEFVMKMLGEMPADKQEITGADGEPLMPQGRVVVLELPNNGRTKD